MSGPELTPDDRLRQLLSEAVEPVQPGPGAEARLQAKIRARRRSRDLPRRLRWVGAALGTAAVVAGAAVAIGTQTGGSSDSSSASSAAGASTPSPAKALRPGGPSARASSASGAKAAAPALPSTARGGMTSDGSTAHRTPSPEADSQLPGAGAGTVNGAPEATAPNLGGMYQAVVPSDLDGDHAPDQLTISGKSLVVTFKHSRQTVTLPQVGAGARVSGVRLLDNTSGGLTPVAFVRLRADSAHVYDTVVTVASGKLTVMRLDGKPVVLTVAGSQGYSCAGPLIVSARRVTNYVVSGADLVAKRSGGVARPGANCGFS
jgi:hypothetical protein